MIMVESKVGIGLEYTVNSNPWNVYENILGECDFSKFLAFLNLYAIKESKKKEWWNQKFTEKNM